MPERDLADSEEQQLHNWLKEQGYPLQLRVAQVFKQAGFDVSQFVYYLDPKEHKPREIDIVASVARQFGSFTVAVSYVIECKYAPKPWIVFTSPKRFGRSFHFWRVLGDATEPRDWRSYDTLQARVVARILTSPSTRRLMSRGLFAVPRTAGNAVVESHSSARNNAYSAVMQVSSCVQANDKQDEQMFVGSMEDYKGRFGDTDSSLARLPLYSGIFFPVVVVGTGHLFECSLAEDGEVSLSRVEDSTVLVYGENPVDSAVFPSCISPVRIVVEDHVKSFAESAYGDITALLSCEDVFREIWDFETQDLVQEQRTEELPF